MKHNQFYNCFRRTLHHSNKNYDLSQVKSFNDSLALVDLDDNIVSSISKISGNYLVYYINRTTYKI